MSPVAGMHVDAPAGRSRAMRTPSMKSHRAGRRPRPCVHSRAPDGALCTLHTFVASAMTERARRESLAGVLADIRAELGPATDEESAWARSVLGL